MAFDKDIVKQELSIEDMYSLLEYLGAEPQYDGDTLISRTVCHGGDSHKLYYYDNTQLFICWTGCGEPFDIFGLLKKVRGYDLSFAIYFVVDFFNLQHKIDEIEAESINEDFRIFRMYEKHSELKLDKGKIILPEYDESKLLRYPQPIIKDWENEFISKEACDYMGIRYNPANGSIIIPHYDENDRLIGVRQRTLVEEDEKYGKYRPAIIDNVLCRHQLGFNLYGLNKTKENIKNIGVALVVEAEKSYLQILGYLGKKNNIAVSMCGSTLSNYQFQLLLDAGAKEICICVDRDFHDVTDEEYNEVLKKMNRMYDKYSPMCNISFMLDTNGITGYKYSPSDCGKDIFIELWNNRIVPVK